MGIGVIAMATVPAKKYKKPDYWRQVERLLRDYPILKLAIEEDQIPSCTPIYEEKTSPEYSEYNSVTEKYAIRMAEKRIKVNKIEKALKVLTSDERKIIEMRYFSMNQPTDYTVCIELNWSKRTYYRVKKDAIRKLALFLNII